MACRTIPPCSRDNNLKFVTAYQFWLETAGRWLVRFPRTALPSSIRPPELTNLQPPGLPWAYRRQSEPGAGGAWGRGEWSLSANRLLPDANRNQNSGCPAGVRSTSTGPNVLRRFDRFSSRLCIEPLWAGFSVTARPRVCDAEYCLV